MMGEFIIECTLCGSSFGNEKEYDSHSCLDKDVKVPFRMKLEPGGDEEEKELENAAKRLLTRSKSRKQREKIQKIKIKEEPADSGDKDPLGISQSVEENNYVVEKEKEDTTEQMEEDGHKEENSVNPIGVSKASEEEDKMVDKENEDATEPMEEDGHEEENGQKGEATNSNAVVMKVTDAVAIRNECGVCGKRFYQREDFLAHTTTSHKIPRPFQCKVCKKRFTQKHYVTLHNRVHTGERPYKCKLCSNTYTHKTSFTIHMRIHNGERPYMCGMCGKKCYDKSGLTSHMRSHTKETPYECEVCGRRFTHSKSLLVHRRNHTGEKPYQCQYCGKCFRHWHKHKIHLRLHTGERPYMCTVCGKGFPRNDEVKRHMRSHQGIKSFKCSICGVYCATQASITGHIDLHHAELRSKDPNAPEKTLVKNSTSGILGTKAPQPRTLYKPIASLVSNSSTQITTTQTTALQGSAKTTFNDTMTKNLQNPGKKIESESQMNTGERTKVLNYKEFIELQEKLLMCKGLTVKDPKGRNNSKNTTKTGTRVASTQKENPVTPISVTGQVLDKSNAAKPLMVVAGQSGQTAMIPRLLSGNQQTTVATTTQMSTSGQRLVICQSPLLLPQNQMNPGGQQILLLSKPGGGGGQQSSMMMSQPFLLLSGGLSGGTGQCMVLMPSKPAAANTATTGTVQTLLIPASAVNTQTSNTVTIKQEPGESNPVPVPVKIAPKIAVKEEPGSSSLPGGVIIKQEPFDDTYDTTSETTPDMCGFAGVAIKQEPQD